MKTAAIIFTGVFLASAILATSHFAKSTSADAVETVPQTNALSTIKTTYSSDIDLNIYSLTGQYIWERNCWNPTLYGLKNWCGYDVEPLRQG